MSGSTSPAPDTTSIAKRASSRVRKQTEHYTSSPFGSSKRKRRDDHGVADADDDVDMVDEEASSEDDDPEDDESAEEEIRENAKRSRKPKSSISKKPPQKKPRVNGTTATTTLPLRTAAKAPVRKKRVPKKTKVIRGADAEAAGGLYAELFAHGKSFEDAVAGWLASFQEHEARALADVINFVLKSAGSNGKVTEHDIEDVDCVAQRLTDLQDEYQATEPSDYPIVAKGKNAAAFKSNVEGLMHTLVKSIGARGELMTQPELIENIHAWLSTMSSASNRSFRHTGTVCCLSVMTALCEITKELAQKAAENNRLAETERKRGKGANKERVKQIEQKAKNASAELRFAEQLLKDWFDTVFIHRYRDIDPLVRKDCVEALGAWFRTYPEHFLDGQHLRYLGWLLSDENGAARGEVVKQLTHLYKDEGRLGGLKTFTERFRSRIVEIGTSDHDVHIQISALELLDLLRSNDLLEPDDIDAVGRLVYHQDPRIRKAVSGFFSANVDDLYASKLEELGGAEALEEVLPEASEDSFESPRLQWLAYKSMAEMLQAYDQEVDLPAGIEYNPVDGTLMLNQTVVESRITLAVDALYDKMTELQDWQALSGYLLFDHSSGRANGVAQDPFSQFKHECILTEDEENVLLEALIATVKHALGDLAEKITGTKLKLSKRAREELKEEQDDAVRHLGELIPRLLKKFGDTPKTAGAVLRLGSVFALPSLKALRQDSASNAALLDDLRKQFMAHGSDAVLGPATQAILHALNYDELDESALEKVASLWEDVIGNLTELLNVATVAVRGASTHEELQALSNNLLRIVRLAHVSNCIDALENSSVKATHKGTGKQYKGAIDFIIDLAQRAIYTTGGEVDPDDAALEDSVASLAAEAASMYFAWKLTKIVEAVRTGVASELEYEALEPLAERRDTYTLNLVNVMDSRRATEPICHAAAGCLLDLYIRSAVLRTIKAVPGVNDNYTVLVMDFDSEREKAIMKVFLTAEKEFASLTGKRLEDAEADEVEEMDVDADPIDDDPLSDEEDEAESQPQTQASQQARRAKLLKPLLAEQRLCQLTGKLVLAVQAGVIDDKATRKRLERNKTKLGPNFREVLGYLDLDGVENRQNKSKPKARSKTPNAADGATRKAKGNPKSNAIVADDETEDEIEDEDQEEEEAQHENEQQENHDVESRKDDEMENGALAEDASIMDD